MLLPRPRSRPHEYRKLTLDLDEKPGDPHAIAHLGLLVLVGSDRQVTWAMTIRAQRLAAIIFTPAADDADGLRACCLITDARWWIDHRDLPDPDLLEKAAQHVIGSKSPAAPDTSIVSAQVAMTNMATSKDVASVS